jgi:hypothetical protein
MPQVYLPGLRSKALVHLMRNGAPVMVTDEATGRRQRATQLPLATYTDLLLFDDTQQARDFVGLHQVGDRRV